MGDLIGKYLVNERAPKIEDDIQNEARVMIENLEDDIQKIVDKEFKKMIATLAKKTGLKRNDAKRELIDSADFLGSALEDFLPTV